MDNRRLLEVLERALTRLNIVKEEKDKGTEPWYGLCACFRSQYRRSWITFRELEIVLDMFWRRAIMKGHTTRSSVWIWKPHQVEKRIMFIEDWIKELKNENNE